jgi:hypothetical protein
MRNDDGMGRGMKGQAKVLCQCVAGHCFLEEDGARARQNYADATSKSGFRDTSLLNPSLTLVRHISPFFALSAQ